jgi:hypothetical protein
VDAAITTARSASSRSVLSHVPLVADHRAGYEKFR